MTNVRVEDIRVANATLKFKNFSGAPGRYNPAGNRNFCWVIPSVEWAEQLKSIGWNVRMLPPLSPDEPPLYYLNVAVLFGKYPPKIVRITPRNKMDMTEATVGELDFADLENVDLVIRPHTYDTGNNQGIKAYLRRGYFTIREDEFEAKYADIPYAPDGAMYSDGSAN